METNKALRWSIVCVAVGYILFSLGTIVSFQVPWMDDVYFADVTWSLMTNGTFDVPVDYPRTQVPVLFYGPVFFVLQAGMWKLLGFGMWQFRLLPILSGLIVFGLGSFYVHKKTASRLCVLLFMLLFAADRTINFYMHAGRMDMTATAFIFGSMLLFGKSLKRTSAASSIAFSLLAGVLLSLGFLTTLRLGFAALPCVLLVFLHKPDSKLVYLRNLALYGGAAALAVIGWLYFAYGGISNAYESVTSLNAYSQHFGAANSVFSRVFRRSYEAPKMLFFYGCAAYLFVRNRAVIRKDIVLCIALCMVLGFILFIEEHGGYRANFMPYVYMLIVCTVHSVETRSMQMAGRWILLGLILLNFFFFTPRLLYIAMHPTGAPYRQIERHIRELISSGSNVIAEYKYYYLLKKAGCNVMVPNRANDKETIRYALSPDGFSATHTIGKKALDWFTDSDAIHDLGRLGSCPRKVPNWLTSFFAFEFGLRGAEFYEVVYTIKKDAGGDTH